MDTLQVTALSFSEVKAIYNDCEELGVDPREVVENIANEVDDFEVDNHRFIKVAEIDDIQQEELKGDAYMLGCFNASFIADHSTLSIDIIEALQSGDKYEELGQHLIDNHNYVDMQEGYASADGYGHHFAGYDHNEHDISQGYLAFRVN